MKKTMMTMMAAAMMLTGATALAATPGHGADCRDNAPCVEVNYAHCGGGHYGHGYGGRGGYGCDGNGYGHRGGYCYGNENNES